MSSAIGPKLFIGNLPIHATSEELQMLLGSYGTVAECHVLKRPSPAGSLCGFVRFRTDEESLSAQQSCDGVFIYPGNNEPIVLRPADESKGAKQPHQIQIFSSQQIQSSSSLPSYAQYQQQQDPALLSSSASSSLSPPVWNENGLKLFVGNLPFAVTEDEIRSTFEVFGILTEVVVLRNPSTSGSRCGFVRFADPNAAQNAISKLNGLARLPGSEQSLTVRIADSVSKSSKGALPSSSFQQPQMMAPPPPSYNNASYNNNRTQQQSNLSAAFGHHNSRSLLPTPPPAAATASSSSSFLQNPPPHQPGELKLFIGNIPNSMSQDTLNAMFSPFGGLLEVVFLFKRGSTSGHAKCAFIRYASSSSAYSALAQLNGIAVGDGLSLMVRVADEKPGENRSSASQGVNASSSSYGSSAPRPIHRQQNSGHSYAPY